ncbi:ral guanine nucleotide dissociation stimulator-like [Cavia porcellus]|uniref:ral guanine nucleotide dissociation stimulator-like n=1 Tax=Cavia porcellus TaxID=10141 RepID=UPI002FE28946
MFSCCFPKCEGSGHKSWWREGVIQRLRGSGSRQAQSLEHTDPRTPKMTQDPRKSSPKLEDAGKVGSMEPDMLKKLVFNLVLAHQRGDPFFVPAFLAIYRRFATTRQVLDLLFPRYNFFLPGSEQDQQNKSALSSILETWLLQYPEDFYQHPDMDNLKQLVAYALLNLPDSDIILQVCRL